MRWPDGTVIMHARAPYDPVKAHEYYLRRRELKGREKAATYTVQYKGKTVKLTARELTEQKVYAAKRVNDIKQKLSELNTKLLEALRTAKAKKAKSTRESSKPPSAAEKSKAARESRKYRDKHKQELATKSKRAAAKTKDTSKSVDPVEELVGRVEKVKETLKAAVAKQRALAGATRN
jgi:hypothetical protein